MQIPKLEEIATPWLTLFRAWDSEIEVLGVDLAAFSPSMQKFCELVTILPGTHSLGGWGAGIQIYKEWLWLFSLSLAGRNCISGSDSVYCVESYS